MLAKREGAVDNALTSTSSRAFSEANEATSNSLT